MNNSELLAPVADYYAAKLAEHGNCARGVDWNGEESQELRFTQLCKLVAADERFSMNDLGCGYGALVDHLAAHHPHFTYHGYDIAAPMVEAARDAHAQERRADFHVGAVPNEPADYCVASGIFNVRLTSGNAEWLAMIHDTLAIMAKASRKGFAFNCLTSYSDAEKMRDYLYYADPLALFDYCKKHFSKQVALLHDYGLYEFTILVRKDA